jgi:hypothetical protein
MSDIENEARDLFVVLSNADGVMAERIMSGDAFTWEVHQIVQAINRNCLEEREKIVAWLRNIGPEVNMTQYDVADAIEAEDHLV